MRVSARLTRLAGIVSIALAAGACGSWQPGGDGSSGASAHRPAATATVSGHVHSPDCTGTGSCPAAAGVSIHFSTAANTWPAVSDSSGAYSVQLPAGTYTVIAGDADRSPYARQLTVEAGDTVTLDLTVSPPTGAS